MLNKKHACPNPKLAGPVGSRQSNDLLYGGWRVVATVSGHDQRRSCAVAAHGMMLSPRLPVGFPARM